MTRLFIRFYLGVIAILIAAWLIQTYVMRERSATQNIRVVEQALSGGARLARDEILAAPAQGDSVAMERVRSRFEYPVRQVGLDADWMPPWAQARLINGDVVLLSDHIAIALDAPETGSPSEGSEADGEATLADQTIGRALLFGPLPQFVGPSQAEVSFGYGVVFLLAAIAIAILLRPVAFQMRAVERTAAAIASGDFSARIDNTKALKDLTLVRAFNSMADRTETLLRSQRELLQAVSHELRTPLARIRFATDLVETAKSEEERRSRLDAIDNATQKLDNLVGELLTYVRMDSNVPDGTPQTIELRDLFSELIEIHAPLNPSIRFHQDPSGHPLEVKTAHDGIARAIENLLSNAARHARSEVHIGARLTDNEVLIEIDDDGEGITPENRQTIFEPFVRLDNSQEPGTGLGLALVHRIAKRNGGSVAVSDSPLGGARFTLRLPR